MKRHEDQSEKPRSGRPSTTAGRDWVRMSLLWLHDFQMTGCPRPAAELESSRATVKGSEEALQVQSLYL